MTVREKIKKARYVFGWVMITEDEGVYLQIQKQSILQAIKETHAFPKEKEYEDRIVMTVKDLYIN